jgi:hypothetical protein
VKNGPRTLLSVAFPAGGLLSESTRAETPSMSERRMNSWRMGVHVFPVRVRKSMVLIHSSVVMLRARDMKRTGERGRTLFMVRFKGRRKVQENALCLGDELMKLADEILEDVLYAAAHREARVCIREREE